VLTARVKSWRDEGSFEQPELISAALDTALALAAA
jgi:hypothetical protein